ncbi:YjgP/YjgQ family permease [Mucilaginibacter robiniae]|uniref:YjgP/YjgQ family permease n=1 Tax=Mucilaginibacter robiniae TaxID=2728022 RepID=A0A7L5DXK7_9SPHI|nr:LptF/LptG family permease [Mucilaginibacter robiniae]QJD94749.1 YjgP/YjgQ family permease [Mucilaginibacter robiniae]
MKKIHLLILKSFIRPFIVTFLIVMFVLLMLFLFKYIDDMIGKGFQWYTILELMMYASFTNVAMALPLSVLLSSIMTYGSLGENYELVAIKSAGISLSRAMYPMMITVTLLSIGAFVFSDYMLPIANFKYYSLLYDVRQQKAAFLITEKVFNNSVPGYTIRVSKKDPDGQTLHDLMIYQKDQATGNMNVVFAKEGIMYRTPDDMQLVLKLKNGVRYEEKPGEPAYDMRQRLTRTRFTSAENRFDLSSFKMHRTSDNDWKSVMQMMNLKQLTISQDSVRRTLDKTESGNYRLINPYVKYFSVPPKSDSVKNYLPAQKAAALSVTNDSEKATAISSALREATSVKDMLKGIADSYKEESKTIRKYSIEYQKKFTLSAACLVLFLIGAPLGAIIRKGGLGLPVVVAVIFFLIYYIIATIGEKSVKEGGLSPAIGMWVSIAVLTPIGIFLSYKAATDSALFDVEIYKRLTQKLTRLIPRKLMPNKVKPF